MTDLKPEDPEHAALRERLEAWAAKERHNARHARGPAFHPPWGQDIIDRHNQNADDLTLALSLLADRARMEKALAVGRTLADAVRLHGYPVSDEHWRKSSGSMSHQARALHLAATAFRQALDGASQ